MDFVHMPETEGKDQVLVVTDRFSKFTILIPVSKTATTEEIYHLLWEQVFAVFGVPETITTDRDKIFGTNRWKKLMASLSVEQILSTSNYQRMDGQTERKMQEIKSFLRMFLENQKKWLEWLPLVKFALNDAVSATTGETPHTAVFGIQRKTVWNDREAEGDDLS